MAKYTIHQIQTLEGIEAIRKRPGMYIGSIETEGLHQIVLEIISNSIDEYLAGECKELIVQIKDNNEIKIIDDGRGVPFGAAKDGTETLENIFTKLHTGAKFNSDGSTGYNSSGGMNGIGSKATNALSEYFDVLVMRDKKIANMKFEKGKRVSYTVKDAKLSTTHGTEITFLPDKTIFKTIELNKDILGKQLKELSFLCPSLIIKYTYKKLETIVYKSTGMTDYIKALTTPAKRIINIFETESNEEKYSVSMALTYTSDYTESIKLYTNNIPNTAGTHLTGFRAAMTRAVNEYAREYKLIKDKDDNLTGEDLKEGLVMVLSLHMPDPIFNGQTKDVLTSAEGRTVVERLLNKELRKWFEKNPNELKVIVSKALLSKKAREAAKKARELTREKSKSVLSSTLQGKLTDCISKNVDDTELFLVEGQSASSGAKAARDKQTQAIMALQGKVLNSEKNDLSKLLNNKEIKALISAIGCNVGGNFDYSKLRYNKIIILADADVDGSHIRVLLLTFFFKYMRELITNGHIYLAMSPLYKVVKGKHFQYLLDDSELEEYREKNKGDKFEVFYFKGLGELDPIELKETTLDISKRRLKQVFIDDEKKVAMMFNKLMSGNVEPRKRFIEENAYKATVII